MNNQTKAVGARPVRDSGPTGGGNTSPTHLLGRHGAAAFHPSHHDQCLHCLVMCSPCWSCPPGAAQQRVALRIDPSEVLHVMQTDAVTPHQLPAVDKILLHALAV